MRLRPPRGREHPRHREGTSNPGAQGADADPHFPAPAPGGRGRPSTTDDDQTAATPNRSCTTRSTRRCRPPTRRPWRRISTPAPRAAISSRFLAAARASQSLESAHRGGRGMAGTRRAARREDMLGPAPCAGPQPWQTYVYGAGGFAAGRVGAALVWRASDRVAPPRRSSSHRPPRPATPVTAHRRSHRYRAAARRDTTRGHHGARRAAAADRRGSSGVALVVERNLC